jgi:hypothetical protein
MAILLTCACGKQFRAKDEFAGKTMKCRNCGLTLVIPDAGPGSGTHSGDALGATPRPHAGVTTPSHVGRTPLPSERVASQPGLFQAAPAETGVASSSRLARSGPAAADPLAAPVPVRPRLRPSRRRALWAWISGGIALLVLFLCGGALTIWWNWTFDEDVGNPAFKGRTEKIDPETFTMLAGGRDIWDEQDQFHFYAKRVIGDFDLEVRVEEIGEQSDVHPWAKAGLMARADLEKGSSHVSLFVTPKQGYNMQRRVVAGQGSVTYPPAGQKAEPCTFPSAWLRLQRTGDDFIGYHSVDGRVWTQLSKMNMKDFPRVAYVGLATTSHDANKSVRARFCNFRYR